MKTTLSEPGTWIRPDASGSPGFWTYRLRFSLDEPLKTTLRIDVEEHYELYLDGEIVRRSPILNDHWDASYDFLNVDLEAGRHEWFVLVWSFETKDSPPAFALKFANANERFGTEAPGWVAARLPNVEIVAPRTSRVRIVGEPTGPGGMDRGAEWHSPLSMPEYRQERSWNTSAAKVPLPPDSIEVISVSGPEEARDSFPSTLGPDGFCHVGPGETLAAGIRFGGSLGFVQLRSSGGVGSRIRVQSEVRPEQEDVYEPRGFRQDFASFGAFLGRSLRITLEGGERGLALFHLQVLTLDEI